MKKRTGLIKPVIVVSYALILVACGGGGGGGGGGGSPTVDTPTTTVDIFDGAALGCSVASGNIAGTEVGVSSPGKYTLPGTLEIGTVVNATGCTDSDTNSKLPAMAGVMQSGGVVISPITTLIVASAIANSARPASESVGRNAARSVSASALSAAKANIIRNLNLGSYDPTDPTTANYVADAKADTAGTGVAAIAMRISLAISTLLKGVEVSAGSVNAEPALSAVAAAIAVSVTAIDLTDASVIQTTLNTASTSNPALATVINNAATAVSASVAAIAGSTGSITVAIVATTAVSTLLNTATAETIADPAVIADLTTATTDAIVTATPNCVFGTSTLGSCKV